MKFTEAKGKTLWRSRRQDGRAGFTVTELMVAVSLMSLIVFALYTMFNQVQKAMRANVSQVDSTERGRAVLELVSRELEAARAGFQPGVTNFWILPQARVFQPGVQGDSPTTVPVGTPIIARTNWFNYVYYLTKQDKAWRGVGFAVLEPGTNAGGAKVLGPTINGMGSLYRYETPETNREYYHATTNLFAQFTSIVTNIDMGETRRNSWPLATNLAHIADGVVHFKIQPYDSNGRLLAYATTNLDSNYRIVRQSIGNLKGGLKFPDSYCETVDTNTLSAANVALVSLDSLSARPFQMYAMAAFRSNALPAYVELELGVLEPDAMKRYDQLVKDGQGAQAKAYLQKRIANVQVFRKRIPFRSVVP